jgi:hypothetical protein
MTDPLTIPAWAGLAALLMLCTLSMLTTYYYMKYKSVITSLVTLLKEFVGKAAEK